MASGKAGPGSWIVFCDFDGTITAAETFSSMLRRFAPDKFQLAASSLKSGERTLPEAIRFLVQSIESTRYGEIIAYIRKSALRPGFEDFLDYLEKNKIPLVVISGGLAGMVRARLGRLADKVAAIHAPEVDRSGRFLKLTSPWESHHQMAEKARVMAEYRADNTVAVGDGLADLGMARAARWVFARGMLSRKLAALGVPHFVWSDFTEIRDKMAEMLAQSQRH